MPDVRADTEQVNHLPTVDPAVDRRPATLGSDQGADLFTRSVQEVLDYLHSATSIPSWSVSRIAHGAQVHLHATGDMLQVGQRVPLGETFCERMLAGAARLVPDATLDPDYADNPHVPAVRAYASAPLTDADGAVFGTLCGISDTPLASEADVDSDLVQMLGRLLSAQLSAARQLDQALEREGTARSEAETDALTGLANRRGWLNAAAAVQDRVDVFGEGVAVVALDLDGLKQVNDTLGHQAGDDLIRRAAHALRDAVRPGDLVARLGGDEFALLLEGVGADQQEHRLQTLLADLETAEVAVSAGVAATSAGTVTVEQALALADARMYEHKRARRAERRP